MDKRHITILGMGPTSPQFTPDGGEVWTLNNAYGHNAAFVPHVTRWFETHSWPALRAEYYGLWFERLRNLVGAFRVGWHEKDGMSAVWQSAMPRDHFEMLAALDIPVYTSEPLPCIRKQVQVDWVKVFSDLNGKAAAYFLGSPSLMLALAIWEHDQGETIESIRSFGIDTSDPRHKQQRQSWAYWCSQAHARGITLNGTMIDFIAEPDTDVGISGLREMIGDAILSKNPPGVASHLGGHMGVTHIDEGALRYMNRVVRVQSMIDIGCGPGGQVEVAKSLGIDAKGIDGDPTVNADILHDFTTGPLADLAPVDLAWSVEFLEHIAPEYIPNIMAAFKCARYVVATANDKPGPWHQNPQPQQYWIDLFADNGFKFLSIRTLEMQRASTMEREFIQQTGMVFKNTNTKTGE